MINEPLTLSDIAKNPQQLTFRFELNDLQLTLRPLEHTDAPRLAEFLVGLSAQTREFYTLNSFDLKMAEEMCDAINKYDKLRFVLIDNKTAKCIGLFEYSLDIPDSDHERFNSYEVPLDQKFDGRIGPCLAEDFQNKGIGVVVFEHLFKIGKMLGKRRLILWGGVLTKNLSARAFYTKVGFKYLGEFMSPDHKPSIDMIINL